MRGTVQSSGEAPILRNIPRAAGLALATTLSAVQLLLTSTSATASVTPAAGSLGQSVVQLPIESQVDMVADGSHRRLFITDRTGGSVLVTDYAGQTVAHLTGMLGASSIVLSPDSRTAYVALRDADAIAAVDTDSLTETARYGTGEGTEPTTLAVAGGKLWFGFGGPGSSHLGSVDVSAADPVVRLDHDNFWYDAPLLASSPGNPDVLVAGDESSTFPDLTVYDVSSGTPQLKARKDSPGDPGSEYLWDLAMTPDGDEIVTAAGHPDALQVFSTDDLSQTGSHPVTTTPVAVGVGADGAIAAGFSERWAEDVFTFRPGYSAPLAKFEVTDQLGGAQTGGIAWGAGADHPMLFVLASGGLHILEDASNARTSVTLTAPTSAKKNKELTLTGAVAPAGTFGPDASVTVIRYDATHPDGLELGSVAVLADSTFAFTDIVQDPGQVRYQAWYSADDWHHSAMGDATVEITR